MLHTQNPSLRLKNGCAQDDAIGRRPEMTFSPTDILCFARKRAALRMRVKPEVTIS
jgi:hypothetical protein